MIIEYSNNFFKEAKSLSKKFKLLKLDLEKAVEEIKNKEDLGVSLGYNLFKKRIDFLQNPSTGYINYSTSLCKNKIFAIAMAITQL